MTGVESSLAGPMGAVENSARDRAVSRGALVAGAIYAGLLLDGLAAYSVFGVPIQWVGSGAIWIGALVLLSRGRLPRMRGIGIFLLIELLAITVTVLSWDVGQMPARATLAYQAFIALRHYEFLTFLLASVLVYFVARN